MTPLHCKLLHSSHFPHQGNMATPGGFNSQSFFTAAVSNLLSFSDDRLLFNQLIVSPTTHRKPGVCRCPSSLRTEAAAQISASLQPYTSCTRTLPLNLSLPPPPAPLLPPHFPTLPTVPPSLCECSAGMAVPTELNTGNQRAALPHCWENKHA